MNNLLVRLWRFIRLRVRAQWIRRRDRYATWLAERLYRGADRIARIPFRSESLDLPAALEIGGKRISIVEDLVAFTKVPRDEIEKALRTRKAMSFRTEWWATPARWRSDHWYYLASKGYLFANASHFLDDEFVTEFMDPNLNGSGARIYDFGAGSGNLSMLLAAAGHEVWCTELSALQRDFIRFRADRHGLGNRVHVVDWWRKLPAERFNVGVAVDVLEHVEDPGGILDSSLLPALASTGLLIERTPFLINVANPMHHPDFGLTEHLQGAGFSVVQSAKDPLDETRVWQRQ